jgi:hypoxanthine phosphoribosyltransferase
MKDGQEIVIGLHRFEVYLAAQEIEKRIEALAETINAEYSGKKLLFISILNGSFMFTADLLKKISLPCEVSFVKMASYEGTSSTNDVKQLIGLNQDLEGRTVVVVEDIVDTGNTVEELKAIFKQKNVKHLKIATLFFKPEAYKKDIKIDYVGIRIPNKFIVGYGLDYDGLGRNLADVYQLAE